MDHFLGPFDQSLEKDSQEDEIKFEFNSLNTPKNKLLFSDFLKPQSNFLILDAKMFNIS
jgi:hypothetical protein